jgi:hypothetical protein
MAATTLSAMPAAITAGDTLLLLLDGGDYPANEGWTYWFSFRKETGSLIEFSSTASGSNHSFTVAADITATWTDGIYKGVGYVESATQRFTVWRGELVVESNLTEQDANYDTRTHGQKALDAINAVLEGKASRDVLASTIAGQSIQRMSFTELLQAKSFYESVVQQEQVLLGQKSNRVLIRFTQPT